MPIAESRVVIASWACLLNFRKGFLLGRVSHWPDTMPDASLPDLVALEEGSHAERAMLCRRTGTLEPVAAALPRASSSALRRTVFVYRGSDGHQRGAPVPSNDHQSKFEKGRVRSRWSRGLDLNSSTGIMIACSGPSGFDSCGEQTSDSTRMQPTCNIKS